MIKAKNCNLSRSALRSASRKAGLHPELLYVHHLDGNTCPQFIEPLMYEMAGVGGFRTNGHGVECCLNARDVMIAETFAATADHLEYVRVSMVCRT